MCKRSVKTHFATIYVLLRHMFVFLVINNAWFHDETWSSCRLQWASKQDVLQLNLGLNCLRRRGYVMHSCLGKFGFQLSLRLFFLRRLLFFCFQFHFLEYVQDVTWSRNYIKRTSGSTNIGDNRVNRHIATKTSEKQDTWLFCFCGLCENAFLFSSNRSSPIPFSNIIPLLEENKVILKTYLRRRRYSPSANGEVSHQYCRHQLCESETFTPF